MVWLDILEYSKPETKLLGASGSNGSYFFSCCQKVTASFDLSLILFIEQILMFVCWNTVLILFFSVRQIYKDAFLIIQVKSIVTNPPNPSELW